MKHLKVIGLALSLFASSVALADTFEVGWDRPGFDYANFELQNPREILCQWRCQQQRGRCKAWTYVNPGLQGRYARCWLKDRVPTPVRSKCCTSGILQ